MKRIHDWTKDDAIIALYYYKFGIEKLQNFVKSPKDLANKYIASTDFSLIMESENIHNLIAIKEKKGIDYLKAHGCPNMGKKKGFPGLSHTSEAQKDVVVNYDHLTEPELRSEVLQIMSGIDIKKNQREVRARRVASQNDKMSKNDWKNR